MTEDLSKLDLSAPPAIEEEPVEKVEEPQEKTLEQYLAEFAGAPSSSQIEEWKQQHGEILCSGLSDYELFVFRPLTREQFTNLQAHLANMGPINNFEVEKRIVEECVLWSSPAGLESLEGKAGTYTTLHGQILLASNFIDPGYAAQLVRKL